jgi:AAA domain
MAWRDEQAVAAVERARQTELLASLRIATLDEFVDVDEPGIEPVLGTEDSALIPPSGDVMVYGDGGVGKTTLMVDLACHLAAGDDWLGIAIARPRRVLLIENEGPRPLFRRKLERKRDAWTGSPLDDRLLVLEEPWGQFTYADADWRRRLAAVGRERQVDVLIVGPLTASGMDDAGTLQQVREFIARVDELRALSDRPIAVILVHHENKGGKVSGAWEGVGDTLLHVQQQGHGRLRLYVQKARWASAQHATMLQLAWAEGEGFRLVEGEPARPERTWDDIETYVLEHGGCAWNEVAMAVSGQRGYLQRRRDQMLADGVLINAGTPASFELWHRDDPARPTLDATGSAAGTGREPADSDPGGLPDSRTGSPVPPLKGEPVPGEPPAGRDEGEA